MDSPDIAFVRDLRKQSRELKTFRQTVPDRTRCIAPQPAHLAGASACRHDGLDR
jgi:hypothetical protein